LRIEDTDISRADAIYENDICAGLSWLGLNWDEFYRESERREIYTAHLKKLYDSGDIFWCPHSKEELAEERGNQMALREAPRHVCSFRDGGSGKSREQSILRFKNNRRQTIEFNDIIRGKISFNPELLGDFSVARSFESPLYNFAVVIDDALTEITHVIRGEDLISSAPKQILLLDALNCVVPEYAHLPLILNTDRSKLSKRRGPTSVNQYRKEGYLAEAMVNFLALLGWHPNTRQIAKSTGQSEDIFSLDYLIENFELENVQKGGAVFDIDKLNWINGEYIRNKTTDELAAMLLSFLKPEWRNDVSTSQSAKRKWSKIVALEQPRLTRLDEINSRVDYFFSEPYIVKDDLKWKTQSIDAAAKNLERLKKELEQISENEFSKEVLEQKIMPIAKELGAGELLWPMRFALSGKKASPGPFEIAEILGKAKVIKRLENALNSVEP